MKAGTGCMVKARRPCHGSDDPVNGSLRINCREETDSPRHLPGDINWSEHDEMLGANNVPVLADVSQENNWPCKQTTRLDNRVPCTAREEVEATEQLECHKIKGNAGSSPARIGPWSRVLAGPSAVSGPAPAGANAKRQLDLGSVALGVQSPSTLELFQLLELLDGAAWHSCFLSPHPESHLDSTIDENCDNRTATKEYYSRTQSVWGGILAGPNTDVPIRRRFPLLDAAMMRPLGPITERHTGQPRPRISAKMISERTNKRQPV